MYIPNDPKLLHVNVFKKSFRHQPNSIALLYKSNTTPTLILTGQQRKKMH